MPSPRGRVALAAVDLIGREDERRALEELASRAAAGRGAIVLLAGEAGVGKTTLARSVLASSDLEPVKGFGVQEGASAYGPIVEALRGVRRRREGIEADP